MRHATPSFQSTQPFRPAGTVDGIEWEELPSLAGRLDLLANAVAIGAMRVAQGHTVWDSTRPAELEPAIASAPFSEPMEGVAFREVKEPDVFRHFFGR